MSDRESGDSDPGGAKTDSQGTVAAPKLSKSLGLAHSVLYGLGVTIGAGIYVLVGLAAGRSGYHWPLAFLIAAAMMLFSAASFAELGTRMPVSASESAYVEAAFRQNWLTLGVGLLVIATAAVSAATISVGSAGYLSVFLHLPSQLIVAGVVLAMAIVACLATVQSVAFAGVMTVLEVAGLLLIVGAGFLSGPGILTRLPEALPPFSLDAWNRIARTALVAVFAFVGFEHLVNISEEMREPRRTLPLALFITLGNTAVLYTLVVWIAVTAVPPDELSRSTAPLALVFERLTGLPLIAMSMIAVVSTLNGVIVLMIMIARVMYGLAEAGRLPRVLAAVHARTRTPIRATALGAVAILTLVSSAS